MLLHSLVTNILKILFQMQITFIFIMAKRDVNICQFEFSKYCVLHVISFPLFCTYIDFNKFNSSPLNYMYFIEITELIKESMTWHLKAL